MKHLITITLLIVTLMLSGCGQKLPPGMPKLYETGLTITQDGSPLTKANVTVISGDYSKLPYSGGGQTDAGGQLRLTTEGRYRGLPAGQYIVTVSKVEGPDIALPAKVVTDAEIAEFDKLTAEIRQKSFEVVGEEFADTETSPLRLEVPKRKTSVTLDVSPKVQRKLAVDTTER
ncbi:MAG: lipoprotein [Planctomycetaceae bacterium]|jgi:hypothetical protein|nr:lipoprotein [Planctomycetaceae bacterium]